MATDHRGNSVGNPATSHGGHQPTPLQNWNKYKTRSENSKEYARNVENEVRSNGGNPDVLGDPYADPYDGSTYPSSLSDPAWEKYEDDHSRGMDEETDQGDYYERQTSNAARRD